MPVFPSANVYYKGRTHTQLVVSEGNAPAERFIPAAAEATKFLYEFGPEGNRNVVIPKGKIVAFSGLEYDVETEKNVPAIKIATTSDVPIGVNHHNVYQRIRDRFSGNAPTVLTREYIRVPLFKDTDGSLAAAIKFGAMWATTAQQNAGLVGKYVKADDNGNFQLADTASDNYSLVVGQIYGIETDIPPAGFLQYFLEMTDNEYMDFLKTTQIVPSPGRTKTDAGTLSIDTFPVGTGYFKTPEDLSLALKSFRAGIPFLTDGYFKARVAKTYANLADAGILDIKTMGGVSIGTDAEKLVSVSDPVGAALFIRLKSKLATDGLKTDTELGLTVDTNHYPEFQGTNPASISVFTTDAGGGNAVQVSAANYHVDYHNNMIVIYFTGTLTSKAVKIVATVLENQIPGIPTGWDFKDCIGEARILLMK